MLKNLKSLLPISLLYFNRFLLQNKIKTLKNNNLLNITLYQERYNLNSGAIFWHKIKACLLRLCNRNIFITNDADCGIG